MTTDTTDTTSTADITPDSPDYLFTVKEASEYLGVTISCLRYNIYTTAYLVPDDDTFRMLRFKKSTLDAFRDTHMADGFTIKEAAIYLNVPVTTIRMYVYALERLKPDARRGNSHIFKKSTLDAFRATTIAGRKHYQRPPDDGTVKDRRRKFRREPPPIVLTASALDIDAIIAAS